MNPFTKKIGLKAFKLWLQTKQNYLILIFRKTAGMAVRQCPDGAPLCEAEPALISRHDAGMWHPKQAVAPALPAWRWGKEERSSSSLGRVRLPMELRNHPDLLQKRANASYLLLRTFLSKYSFQPFEMVWFSFLLQNRETVGQEPVPKRQLQVKRGCGALSRQHQEACVTLLPTCLWASAKLKGRVPSSRGAIRSMSAKVMRLERKANVSNNKTQTKI